MANNLTQTISTSNYNGVYYINEFDINNINILNVKTRRILITVTNGADLQTSSEYLLSHNDGTENNDGSLKYNDHSVLSNYVDSNGNELDDYNLLDNSIIKNFKIETFEYNSNSQYKKVTPGETGNATEDAGSNDYNLGGNEHTVDFAKPQIKKTSSTNDEPFIVTDIEHKIQSNGYDVGQEVIIKVKFNKAIRLNGGIPQIKIVEHSSNFRMSPLTRFKPEPMESNTGNGGAEEADGSTDTPADKTQTHWKYNYIITSKAAKIGKIIISDATAKNGLKMDVSKEYIFKIAQYPLINILKSFDKNKNIGPTADNSSRISRFKRIHRKTRFYNYVTNKGERTRLWGHNQLKNRSGTEGSSSTRIYFSSIFPRMTFR